MSRLHLFLVTNQRRRRGRAHRLNMSLQINTMDAVKRKFRATHRYGKKKRHRDTPRVAKQAKTGM